MKHRPLIAIMPLFLLNLVSCVDTKVVNSFCYYKVADECINMGTISGKARQNPLVGDYTTEVVAVAKDGFVFVKWDDGCTDASRSDLATAVPFVTYIAYFDAVE